MLGRLTLTYAVSPIREFDSWLGVLDTTLCDKVCKYLAAGRRFYPGTPNSSTGKIYRHDKTDILLKVVLNTHNLYDIGYTIYQF